MIQKPLKGRKYINIKSPKEEKDILLFETSFVGTKKCPSAGRRNRSQELEAVYSQQELQVGKVPNLFKV